MKNFNEIEIGTLHKDGTKTPLGVPAYHETYNDGDEIFYECENTILVNTETGERHRLFIKVMNFYEATGEEEYKDKPFIAYIGSLIDGDSLTDKMRANIVHSGCIKEEDITSYDIESYGYAVPFEKYEAGSITDFKDWIDKMLPRVEFMYGFYMDRPVNRIGTNGWDFIKGNIF